jgi:hypothetical protein
MPEFPGEIHRSHPTPAQLPFDLVRGADNGPKTLQWIFHREPRQGTLKHTAGVAAEPADPITLMQLRLQPLAASGFGPVDCFLPPLVPENLHDIGL